MTIHTLLQTLLLFHFYSGMFSRVMLNRSTQHENVLVLKKVLFTSLIWFDEKSRKKSFITE